MHADRLLDPRVRLGRSYISAAGQTRMHAYACTEAPRKGAAGAGRAGQGPERHLQRRGTTQRFAQGQPWGYAWAAQTLEVSATRVPTLSRFPHIS